MKQLSKQEARDFLVQYQMINTNASLSKKEGILTVMNRLNSIQYDPLDVVGKNIDLVMQSRVPDYTRSLINEMLYQDRTLIDGWDKMMAVYMTKDFPNMKHVRDYRFEAHKETLKYRLQMDALEIMGVVLEIIKESPKYSSELSLGDSKKHRWGSTKQSSAALDCLFHKGDIGVRERRNTQKQYDIISNLIGDIANTPTPFATNDEFTEYFLLRRIQACGLFSNKNGVHASGPYIQKKSIRNIHLKTLLEKGFIEEVQVEGINEVLYMPVITLENELIDQVSIIAPLDNLIWDRALIEKLYDFRYRWEVYTPIVKREYGYYVLPLVYRSTFIGRIEFKQHRRKDKLEIINIWLEDSLEDKEFYKPYIDDAIARFERYLVSED